MNAPAVNTYAMIAHVLHQSGLSYDDLVGPSRLRWVNHYRFALYTAMREHGLSYPQIARRMFRDHSTVISGCDKAIYLKKKDPKFKALVNDLIEAGRMG